MMFPRQKGGGKAATATVPVHDGSLLAMEHAEHGTVHLFAEQRFRAGQLKSGLPSLISADQVRTRPTLPAL